MVNTRNELVEIFVAGAWRYLALGDHVASLGLYKNRFRITYSPIWVLMYIKTCTYANSYPASYQPIDTTSSREY